MSDEPDDESAEAARWVALNAELVCDCEEMRLRRATLDDALKAAMGGLGGLSAASARLCWEACERTADHLDLRDPGAAEGMRLLGQVAVAIQFERLGPARLCELGASLEG